MPHRIVSWLEDVHTSIGNIDDYLGTQRNYFVYQNNKMLRQSIELNLILIGETVNNLLKQNPELPLTNARKIVNLRNLIVHSYDDVDNTIIWSIIVNHLPTLKVEIEGLLAKYDTEQ